MSEASRVRSARTAAEPSVLAVLVVNDGAQWLDEVLDALARQTYGNLEIVAVDNGSRDGSRERLIERLGPRRVLVAERDLGFGAAVAMALDSAIGRTARMVFLCHDDAAPDDDAVERLVDHLRAFPRVAIAGSKKVDWSDPSRLQSVGWSVDITGRADSGVEADERDQGQHDHVRPTLYVSTAGMLVRTGVFRDLGGFDRRYHLFRDDLDLCWRAWIAGHQVEIVPGARVRHAAGATNYERLGQTAFLGPRYFAERNTLATLLKNYGAARLALVVPLFALVGVLKVLGFVAMRRLSDASQTLRAWVWNLLHLRETWRYRRTVQRLRIRSDGELKKLFTRVIPRVRAYAEAVVDTIAGGRYEGQQRVLPADGDLDEPPTIGSRMVAAITGHPVVAAGSVLAVVGLIVALPLLGDGVLRGGQLAAWPAEGSAFLSDYAGAWHDAGAGGTSLPPSPAQALLVLVDIAALGSAWLAPRLLVLGALPLAWVLALRAGRIVSERRLPRLAAATVYALSPPAVAAVLTGRISALAVLVALPVIVIAFAAMTRSTTASVTAWRATAVAALVTAAAIAFAPATLIGFVAWGIVALAAVPGLEQSPEQRRGVVLRIVAWLAGAVVLLLPWSATLPRPDGPLLGAATGMSMAGDPFWRWLLLSPDATGFPVLAAGIGLLAAGVLGLALAFRRHPLEVAALWAAALAGVFAAWGLGRAGSGAISWPGLPLIVTAGAFAGLLALGLTAGSGTLARHDFGWRQLGGGVTTLAVLAGLGASLVSFVGTPWDAYSVGSSGVPAFLEGEREQVGPFRVLLLVETDRGVQWDLTGPGGSTMTTFGVPRSEELHGPVAEAVTAIVAGSDPSAAARLGLLNIRFVVVPPGGGGEVLSRALGEQLDLEPEPVTEGALLRVRGWLPRAAWISPAASQQIADRGELPIGAEPRSLAVRDGPEFAGAVPGRGSVALSEADRDGWRAVAAGTTIVPESLGPVVGFPVGDEVDHVVIERADQGSRTAWVVVQLALTLLAISFVLRPPRFAGRQSGTGAAASVTREQTHTAPPPRVPA